MKRRSRGSRNSRGAKTLKTSAIRRRAIIAGPMVASPRELSRTLFSVGVDPVQLRRDLRVAVDGGLRTWRMAGMRPHFAVGDWDSLAPEKASAALKGLYYLTLPKTKDRSDLYYACRATIAAEATDLICVGVTGGRPDHQLATLMDLSEIHAQSQGLRSLVAADSSTRYYFLSERQPRWEAKLPPKQTVSIFSLDGTARGVTLEGFRYPLKNAMLKPSSLGLSNQVARSNCSVKIRQGRVVVMVLSEDFR